jgi:amino acid adenylation domain-containing protein
LGRAAAAGARAVAQAAETSPFVVIFGYRCKAAFLGIVSTLKAGKAYLPVSHKFPPHRLIEILHISQSTTLFLAEELAGHFRKLLDEHDNQLPPLTVLYLPEEREAIAPLINDFPRHRYVAVDATSEAAADEFPVSTSDDFAYMLFTSGSTGKPKGIAITNDNVCAYLDAMLACYDFHNDDRFSQCFDLTFDYSVHDMFCCWLCGACLCVVPTTSLIAPAKFVEKSGITVWFSVPSLAMTMDKMRMLRPGRFDKIRLSFFGGEAVSQSIAQTWQAAAPNSVVHNVYGPTEATINVTHYRWNPERSPAECVNGGVPLGHALPGLEIRVVDASGHRVPPGDKGELMVAGPQVAPGYFQNPEKTAQAFRTLAGDQRVWYGTGDLVSRDAAGLIRYFGRMDFQVQICGHRVELAAIEALLRTAAQTEYAVAIPWPYAPETGRADSVIAVIGATPCPGEVDEAIRAQCQASLPAYAVPSQIVHLDEFPLNINGKTDRKAIAAQLGEILP